MRNDLLPPPPPDVLCKTLEVSGVTIDWLAGDGSDRCYYRVKSSELSHSYVLMQLSEHDAKLLRENGYDWVHMAELLTQEHVRVPKLRAKIPEFAALLIEDYGDQMLETDIKFKAKAGQPVSEIYMEAVDIISSMLKISPDPKAIWCQRSFDAERFKWELNFFVKKYLDPICGISFNSEEALQFANDVDALSSTLSKYSKYFVHRDFHSRNLMMRSNELAVIDFQDARLGPPTYDLVSLIFDSYVPLSIADRRSLLTESLNKIGEFIPEAECREWPGTLLQRQLKAIGSFGYLTLEKGRGDYLGYVKPALSILLETPELVDERWPFLSGELLERMKKLI